MNKYGPISEDLLEDARNIAWTSNPDMYEIADVLYDWYVKGLVAGINLTEES